MLVPVQGGVENLQKRTRPIFEQQAALSTVEIPCVYIFNVGPRKWKGVGGGKEYIVPACPPGREYSEPVEVSTLCIAEFDPAGGDSAMGVHIDAGASGVRVVNGEKKTVMGVADDVIGKNSTAAGLELTTTNGAWFGLFVSKNEEPTQEELEEARDKLRQMMQLIYATGAEKVQAGEKVAMLDRPRYNEAAAYLGAKPLWGSLDHTRASCPECHEDIIEGANFCKHCQQAIDPASVAARAKKRQRDAEKMAKEEETA
jgi:hypothetical protein